MCMKAGTLKKTVEKTYDSTTLAKNACLLVSYFLTPHVCYKPSINYVNFCRQGELLGGYEYVVL